jgi:tol-pal system protein YbgF
MKTLPSQRHDDCPQAHVGGFQYLYSLRSFAVLASAVLSLSSVSVEAGIFDDDEARKAIIELRGKVEAGNRDTAARLNALSQRTDEMAQRLERIEAAQRGQLELQGQIEALKRELAELRGRLEVQTNELAKTQLQQRDMASNLEARLGTIDNRVKKVEPSFVSVNIDDKNFNVDQEEKRRYDAALALLRGSDFRASAVAFAQFLTQYPDSPLAAYALYWNASSLFGLKDYRASISANERFLGRYPEHPRASEAALSIAFSQIELNDRIAARKSLETVAEKYPNSDSARQARERLATLRR